MPELFGRIAATPRPAGSAAEASARAFCAETLRRSGYAVAEQPFEYSIIPGLWAIPAVGLALMLVAANVATRSVSADASTDPAFQLHTVFLLAGVAAVAWWGGRFGTRSLPFGRQLGINLEATNGTPRVWLVAHVDTKQQPVSLLVRAIGAVVTAVAWTCILLIWAASRWLQTPHFLVTLIAAVAGLSAVALALSWVMSSSDGALDNASGVAAVVRAAQLLQPIEGIGVLLTSAEELGLAGARAWVAERRAQHASGTGISINCDGVDDIGVVTVTLARDPQGLLGRAAREAGNVCGVGARLRNALPGVFFDAVAMADAGWSSATVSKGSWRSLARVHTRSDNLAAMDGRGIEATARFLATMAGVIIAGCPTECTTGDGG